MILKERFCLLRTLFIIFQLTDNTCSLVRKEAVFCIVKLYVVMGEEMVKPKLTVLPPSKIR